MTLTIEIHGKLNDNRIGAVLHEIEHDLAGTDYEMSGWERKGFFCVDLPDDLHVHTTLSSPD